MNINGFNTTIPISITLFLTIENESRLRDDHMTISIQFRPNPPISELSIECSNKNLSSVLILNQCNFLQNLTIFFNWCISQKKKYFQLLLFCYAYAESHAESIFLRFPLSKTHSCVPYNQSIWFIDSHDEQTISQFQTSFLSRNEHMKYSLL